VRGLFAVKPTLLAHADHVCIEHGLLKHMMLTLHMARLCQHTLVAWVHCKVPFVTDQPRTCFTALYEHTVNQVLITDQWLRQPLMP
jgi:hypothetical protein